MSAETKPNLNPYYCVQCDSSDCLHAESEKKDAQLAALRNSHDALVAAAQRVQKWRSSAGAYCNGDYKALAEIRADFEALDAALASVKP